MVAMAGSVERMVAMLDHFCGDRLALFKDPVTVPVGRCVFNEPWDEGNTSVPLSWAEANGDVVMGVLCGLDLGNITVRDFKAALMQLDAEHQYRLSGVTPSGLNVGPRPWGSNLAWAAHNTEVLIAMFETIKSVSATPCPTGRCYHSRVVTSLVRAASVVCKRALVVSWPWQPPPQRG
jgi:hypothetical protein